MFAIVPSNLCPCRILRCTSARLKLELLCIVTSNMMQNYLTLFLRVDCDAILYCGNRTEIAEGEQSPYLEGKIH